jgi:hypothetical protein
MLRSATERRNRKKAAFSGGRLTRSLPSRQGEREVRVRRRRGLKYTNKSYKKSFSIVFLPYTKEVATILAGSGLLTPWRGDGYAEGCGIAGKSQEKACVFRLSATARTTGEESGMPDRIFNFCRKLGPGVDAAAFRSIIVAADILVATAGAEGSDTMPRFLHRPFLFSSHRDFRSGWILVFARSRPFLFENQSVFVTKQPISASNGREGRYFR